MKFLSLLLVWISLSYDDATQIVHKRSIQILSVPFLMETVISVPCEQFTATSFKYWMSVRQMSNQDSIKTLDNYLDTINYSNESANIDTRAKFVFKNAIS